MWVRNSGCVHVTSSRLARVIEEEREGAGGEGDGGWVLCDTFRVTVRLIYLFADQYGLQTSKLTGTLPSVIGVLSALKIMSVTLSYLLPLPPPFRYIICGEGRESYHSQ